MIRCKYQGERSNLRILFDSPRVFPSIVDIRRNWNNIRRTFDIESVQVFERSSCSIENEN